MICDCLTVDMQPPDQPLSVAEWRELKESLGNPQLFAHQMMIALYSSGAELDVAKWDDAEHLCDVESVESQASWSFIVVLSKHT